MESDRYALVVGIGNYVQKAGVGSLPFALNDARSIARLLRNRRIGQFPEFNVTLILDGGEGLIRRKLEELFNRKKRDDLVVVFFSGHGVRDDQGDLYLLASNTESDLLASTSIPVAFIKQLMARSHSSRQVLILDACFSGAVGEQILSKGPLEATALSELSGEGRYIMAASSAVQVARRDNTQEYSLFTRFLIQGLATGAADADKDGLIAVDELFDFARQHVIDDSKGEQTPKSWGLGVAGQLILARDYHARNRLLAEFKISPEAVLSAMMDWHLNKFEVTEGLPIDKQLITRPIITRAELSACYTASPSIQRVKAEVTATRSEGKWWLFVSPRETGKTSLLSSLSVDLVAKKPGTNLVKIERIPAEPNIDDFYTALRFNVKGHLKTATIVFDDNLTEPGCLELIKQLKESQRINRVLATCTPDQYSSAREQGYSLGDYFEVREAPGYASTDYEFFESFVDSWLTKLSGDDKKRLLAEQSVTMAQLCALYKAAHSASRILSGDQVNESRTLFASLPRTAQLLAQVICYLESVPERVLQQLVSKTDLFVVADYNLLLEDEFIWAEVGIVGLSAAVVKSGRRMRQADVDNLLPFEKKLVIDTLLELAFREEDSVTLGAFAQTLSSCSKDMDDSQTRTYRQLTRLAKGGKMCGSCGVCSFPGAEWCPSCGRRLRPDPQVEESVSKLERRFGFSVPFPPLEFCSDADRPRFNWPRPTALQVF